jgi:broad specificity phosphatase PhoE
VLEHGLTLYVVRHGETDWNAAGRLQGQTDIPLNDNGRAQAAQNGMRLAHAKIDPAAVDFIASPLSRAYETMTLLRQAMGLPREGFKTDVRLKELSYGRCEGSTWQQLPPIDANGVARHRDPYNWLPDGGESYADAMRRTAGWLSSITRDAVVVTHGGITRTLRGLVAGVAIEKVPTLKVPQDRVLVLRSGTMSWLH